MKKFALLALFAISAFGADIKGTISDSKCGKAHVDASEKSQKCVAGCVKGGSAPVLVTEDGKILKIDDASKVADHLGHKVIVDGTVEGDTVTVASVKMQ
jgi:hypothetical protein